MFTFLFAKLNKLSDSSKILPQNLQKYVFYQQRFVPVFPINNDGRMKNPYK